MPKRRKGRPPRPVAPSPPTRAASLSPPPEAASPLHRLGAALLLFTITFVAYLPAVRGGFIWDDTVLLTENPLIKAADGLYRFWFTTEAPDYWPLTSTTFWIEWRLWGMNPVGYHLTNIALHCLEAALLWLILTRLGVGGAYLATLIFALHPVNVESVAWIAQRKNLVAMLFLELAILCYLRADDDDQRAGGKGVLRSWSGPWYWATLVMLVLAMLGKGSAAVLPLILLLLVWWRRRHLTLRDLGRVSPLFVAAALLVWVNIWFQTHGAGVIRNATLGERALGAGAVVWFYLWKALVPLNLAFVYPLWRIDAADPRWWLPSLAIVGVTGLLWRHRETWARPFLFAGAFFGIGLLPVMGFTDVYFMTFSLVADHYQHIAIVGVIALVAAGWAQGACGGRRARMVGVAAIGVGALACLTRQQSATYKNEDTLYTATLETNPHSWLAHHNLGASLSTQGRRQEALAHYLEVVRLNPDFVKTRVNLALMLGEDGRSTEAIDHLQAAVRLEPESPLVRYNLGVLLAAAGRPEEAVPHYEEALRHRADDPEAHNALGAAQSALGRYEEACAHIEEALRLKPDYAVAYANLAFALAHRGQLHEAITRYEDALRLNPAYDEAHYNLAGLLIDAGQSGPAISHYEEALRLRPDYWAAHNNLALALGRDRSDEAIGHFREAIRINPDFFEARMNLVVALARLGRSSEAGTVARDARDVARSRRAAAWEKWFSGWLTRLGSA